MFLVYNTPLHKAAILGLADAVAIIIAAPNVDLFVTNADGLTPYQAACSYSSSAIIDMIEDLMPLSEIDERVFP